ncbi:putative FlgJ-related protein [Malaciobacter marinus]|jgi:Bax protein|uniref:FlgJ-related protein n=1 Tax=Malaciobacter marinus TaxID=505249 RepID=A0AB36ZY91_9BACT|nr:glucosaminidase domain-containing protein [Malaciobacter marinus]PPK61781.1 putative FlgJ-related protein [Malaciobacter marinus]
MKRNYLIAMSIIVLLMFGYFYQLQNKQVKQLKQEIVKLNERIDTLEKSEESLKAKLDEALEKSKPKPIPVSVKKKRFIDMMVPALNEVYDELKQEFFQVQEDIKQNKESEKIQKLKEFYKVNTNQELLYALKPHPKSIALAQGAMESAWGQSRFFKEANNIFGVWSFNKSEPRIAASGKRGSKTIWLKKYSSVKEAIKDYYITLSRSSAFKEFRKTNFENPDPFVLVTKLDRYSEKKAAYGKELAAMIKYNNFTKYDDKEFIVQKEQKQLTKEDAKKEEEFEKNAIENGNDEVTTSSEIEKTTKEETTNDMNIENEEEKIDNKVVEKKDEKSIEIEKEEQEVENKQTPIKASQKEEQTK